MELGEAIRARRGELGLTLEGLAERAGVSRAMLSEIEREVKTPTIRVLSQIATGLATTVGQLIGEAPARNETPRTLVRLAERQTLIDPRTGVVSQMLDTGVLGKAIGVRWYIVPPGQQSTLAATSGATEALHLTVVRGTMRCQLGGREETLAEGDSCGIAADQPCMVHNTGAEACHLFLVSAPQGN